jgi:hypothetical protein
MFHMPRGLRELFVHSQGRSVRELRPDRCRRDWLEGTVPGLSDWRQAAVPGGNEPGTATLACGI